MKDDNVANFESHIGRKCIYYYFTEENEECLLSLYNKSSLTGVTYD